MDLLEGYRDPDLNAMNQEQLIVLVHRVIHLIQADRLLSEAVFHYTPAEMDEFIRLVQAALSARQESKLHMIQLIEALYGDPILRELFAASTDVPSQRIHKRAKIGGRRRTKRRRTVHYVRAGKHR